MAGDNPRLTRLPPDPEQTMFDMWMKAKTGQKQQTVNALKNFCKT
jgi:hypothetical protein